jgi:hypothetical protein
MPALMTPAAAWLQGSHHSGLPALAACLLHAGFGAVAQLLRRCYRQGEERCAAGGVAVRQAAAGAVRQCCSSVRGDPVNAPHGWSERHPALPEPGPARLFFRRCTASGADSSGMRAALEAPLRQMPQLRVLDIECCDMPEGAPASHRELTVLSTLSRVCCQLPELRLPEAMPGDTPGSLRLLTY